MLLAVIPSVLPVTITRPSGLNATAGTPRWWGKGGPSGAYVFIWVWLVVAILNGAYGVMRAGIPLINELGAFIPIFGIPVLVAWYLAFKYGAPR